MLRKFGRWTVGVVACGFGLLFSAGAMLAEPKADDFASIHDIMTKGHQGKKSYLAVIKEGVKAEKWDDIAEPAKKLKKFGEDLGKNKPDKGESDSWKKLNEEYKKTMVAIGDGVEKKDAKATNEALTKMGKSCKSCHDSHK